MDSVVRVPPRVDVSGAWATGGIAEPAMERVFLRVECNSNPSSWILQQSGDTVRLWIIPASFSQGIATRHVVSSTASVGRISGNDVTIGGPGARYALHYDSTSGHLRGTLNGERFWAIRQEIVRPEHCLAIP